jgi:hypothetical protein
MEKKISQIGALPCFCTDPENAFPPDHEYLIKYNGKQQYMPMCEN